MNPAVKSLLDFLATVPGARPAIFFALLWMTISPRVSCFIMASVVVAHMLWANP